MAVWQFFLCLAIFLNHKYLSTRFYIHFKCSYNFYRVVVHPVTLILMKSLTESVSVQILIDKMTREVEGEGVGVVVEEELLGVVVVGVGEGVKIKKKNWIQWTLHLTLKYQGIFKFLLESSLSRQSKDQNLIYKSNQLRKSDLQGKLTIKKSYKYCWGS